MRPFLVLVVVFACACGGAEAGQVRSGLHGTVLQQMGGACLQGTDCKSPAAGTTLAFSRGGQTLRTRTSNDGSYRVRLVPGVYIVRVVGEDPSVTIRPSTARVRRARFSDVDFKLSGSSQIP